MTRFVVATVLALAASLFAVLLVGAAAKPEPISGDDFARSVRALSSAAREVSLVAEALEGERLTQSFAAIHRDKLEETVADEREKLDTTFPAPLAANGARARDLGRELSEAISRLKLALADRDALEGIRRDAARIDVSLTAMEPRP